MYLEPGTTSISVEVTNTKTNYVQEQRIFVDNRYLEDLKRDNHAPVAQITLQGVMSEAKTLSGNILICEADRCNVNITGKDSFDPDGEKLQVLWNL
ncbi:MAG: hypothetical protein H6767_04785 [Candidatus Peribacteria bacterium]|nr:MAG: hypothetical protein H6767_04785 [Candidatus Peribacteria bacterium]